MSTTQREAGEPGWVQAAILLVSSGLTVLVTAVLGPSLPLMQQHFKDVANAEYLVPLTMTAPMLTMAVLSVFAGWLSDRIGRKRLLVGATLLYGVLGTAPVYLQGIAAIVASRIALGAMEAVLLTVSTAMIGDYYDGPRRERIMALQVTVASVCAFLLNTLGGVLAEHGWRTPYFIYAVSFALAPLMAYFLWEPHPRGSARPQATALDGAPALRAALFAWICALGVLSGLVFLVVPVHFGYLFTAIGVASSMHIGAAYGVNSLGVIAGTLLFGWVIARRLPVAGQMGLAMLIASLGFVLMEHVHTYEGLAIAGLLNGLGCGILLPVLVTWAMRVLPAAQRGVGNGAFQSSYFLGQFLSGFTVVALQGLLGGQRASAVGAIGMALGALGLTSLFFTLSGRRVATRSASPQTGPARPASRR
jgi:MFS family permease